MASGICPCVSRSISVLFVDDDEDTLFAYRLLATEEGMRVAVAHDGHEASALANLLMPDVIVLDVGLRGADGLDGYEVARRLRADAATTAIPILIVTGHDSERDVARARECGCDAVLVKPCAADELFELVTALATRNHQQGATA